MPEIKICGITSPKEAQHLNKAKVEYAGFVLYEKSKRYIDIEKIKEIFNKLNKDIIKVAVVVSPNKKKLEEIEGVGFDVIQIHGRISEELLEERKLPIWRAINLTSLELLERELNEKIISQVSGVLLDAREYGSGQSFDWNFFKNQGDLTPYQKFRGILRKENKKFILAGGLNPQNVEEGIEIFSPDVVDVSSGVEDLLGKDEKAIMDFVRAARSHR